MPWMVGLRQREFTAGFRAWSERASSSWRKPWPRRRTRCRRALRWNFRQVSPEPSPAATATVFAHSSTCGPMASFTCSAHTSRVKAEIPLSTAETVVLQVYERTMVANRRNKSGRIVGGRIHTLVRITPRALPVGFSLLWLYTPTASRQTDSAAARSSRAAGRIVRMRPSAPHYWPRPVG